MDGEIVALEDVVGVAGGEWSPGPGTGIGTASLESGSFLGVGVTKVILEVERGLLDNAAAMRCRELVRNRLDVRYEWCSVYDECLDGCTKEGCTVGRSLAP